MNVVSLNKSDFRKLVLEEKKAAVIDFGAPWCVYCRRLAPVFQQVADAHPELLTATVNIDEQEALADQFGVETIPTLLAFKDGALVGSVVNPGSKGKIEEFIQEYLG